MATSFMQVKNRALSTIAGAINDSDDPVTFSVAAGEGAKFPATASGHFNVTIDDEIMHCTSRSTDALTCVRAQEGTAKAAHLINAPISLNLTAQVITDLNTAVNAVEAYSVLTERGSIVFRDASAPAELLHGTAGQLLKSGGHGADPSWTDDMSTVMAIVFGG